MYRNFPKHIFSESLDAGDFDPLNLLPVQELYTPQHVPLTSHILTTTSPNILT